MKELIKIAVKVGLGAGGAVLLAALTLKFIAVFWGVAAVGLFSIYRSVYQILVTVGTLNGQNAIIQNAANLPPKSRLLYSKYMIILFSVWCTSSFIVIALFFDFFPFEKYFENISFHMFVAVIVISMVGAVSVVLGALVNGYHQYGKVALSKLIGASSALLVTLLGLFLNFNIDTLSVLVIGIGAFTSSIYLLVCLSRMGGLAFKTFFTGPYFDRKIALSIWRLSLFSFFTALILAVSVLLVRAILESRTGLHGVGLFEAAWSLSMTYTMVMLSSLGSYYLPQLTLSHGNRRKTQLNVLRMLRFVLIVSVPGICILQVIKATILILLFDQSFTEAIQLFKIMLLGDYFKAVSWVFSYVALASRNLKTLLAADSVWSIFFLLGCYWIVGSENYLEGIGWLFSSLYLCYLLFFYRYVQTRKIEIPVGFLRLFASGFICVLFVTYINWEGTTLLKASLSVLLIGTYILFSIKKREAVGLYTSLKKWCF